MSPAALIATVGGVGRMPSAPGTFGTLAALPMGWALHWFGGFPLLAMGVLAAVFGGVAATRIYLDGADRDPPEVVIDEVAGLWIALLPLSFAFWQREIFEIPWPGWLAAFCFFRLFDIWKPWPVSAAERIPGAWGVMLDDVVAGVLAGLSATALGVAYHLAIL